MAYFIIIALIVMALVLWAINEAPKIDGTLRAILRVATILITALVIAQRAGWLT